MAVASVLVLSAKPAAAWHGKGHYRATLMAVEGLPDDVPEFFRKGGATIAHCSLDPDVFTNPIAPKDLHKAESPDHYLDLERLGGDPIPPLRYDLMAWCVKHDVPPATVGFLPYAIVEWTQRLSTVFAEHRKWPTDPFIRTKALVYAGNLSHYAADLCMPLHTTVHYDGRQKPDGSSPKTGIHLKTDALPGKLSLGEKIAIDPKAVQPLEDLLKDVIAEFMASHRLVARVYELESVMPAYAEPLDPKGAVADFTRERLKAAALLVARVMLTAWRDSAQIEIPKWHHRPAFGGEAGP
jgi:hypothetical protein